MFSMEMIEGAVGVAACWLTFLGGKHGFAWVASKIKGDVTAIVADVEGLKGRVASLEASAKAAVKPAA